MSQVRIESSDPGDAAVHEDLRIVLREQPGRSGDWGERLLASLAPSLCDPFGLFLSARSQEGELLGGALALNRQTPGEASPRPWLAALWVLPRVRNQGLGRRLMELLEEKLRQRDAREILASVNPEDDAILFLGERWGWSRERLLLSRPL
ncbi:MAG: GNAT family N-acetyltransferase [Planctomycetota bacterium]